MIHINLNMIFYAHVGYQGPELCVSCQAIGHLLVMINKLPRFGVVCVLSSNRTFISGDKSASKVWSCSYLVQQ